MEVLACEVLVIGMDGVRVGVVGGGTMGIGIAITSIRAGLETLLLENRPQQVLVAMEQVESFLEQSVLRGKCTALEAKAMISRLRPIAEFEQLSSCDVVIEAITEQLPAKQQLFRDLGSVINTNPVLVTNTSTLSVTSISAAASDPSRVIGMHFCNPAPIMPLIEVVDGMRTSSDTHRFAIDFAKALGKQTVVVRDSPGFVVNRLLIPFENSCIRQLENGSASVEDIDRSVRSGLGHPMGVFQLLDIVGLDVHRAVSLSLFEQLRDPRYVPPPLVDRMIALGYLGRKSGRGFYTYDSSGVFGT